MWFYFCMDIVIFTECPTRDYFRSLIFLEDQGKIKVEFMDSRFFYLLALKFYASFSFLRTLAHRLFGKPKEVVIIIRIKDVWKSFISYFTLPFTRKTIVALFAPYGLMGVYLWILKKCNRKIIFYTSWPYWDEQQYVRKPNIFTRIFWNSFLQDQQIVTVSKTGKKALQKYSSFVEQIPHGVDLVTFCSGEKKEEFTVLYVGRIIKEKGLEEVLFVAKELPYISFVFIGTGSLLEVLERRAEEWNLLNVKFLGEIRDRKRLAQFFQESSVFVLNSYRIPKWEELYGIVILESLASGTPVISTDCVGPREIVQKDFGILIPQKSKEHLKKAILILYNDIQKCGVMGKKGRAYVEKTHDLSVLADRWYTVLSEKKGK